MAVETPVEPTEPPVEPTETPEEPTEVKEAEAQLAWTWFLLYIAKVCPK